MVVDAFAAGDGEQPGGKNAARIKFFQILVRLHKGVLGDLAGIGRIPAKLADKGMDAVFVAADQFLESLEEAGLRLSGQFLV